MPDQVEVPEGERSAEPRVAVGLRGHEQMFACRSSRRLTLMPIHLVIGLVDVRQPQGAPESAGRDAVWRDRPKLELDVEEYDALAAVLKRASEEFARAIPELPGAPMDFHVAFHDGGDDDPPPPLRSTHGVPLVDENGAA